MMSEPGRAKSAAGANAPADVTPTAQALRPSRASVERPAKSVERLFPFALRARILIPGQDRLRHSKSRLHFVLITEDASETTRSGILRDFAAYPVVQHYTSAELERLFGLRGAKVVGFAKSHLAKSIYAELKSHRLNKPNRAG